ncbi:MAG TPA: hypothetical protein PKW84_07265 [Fervidobacterium sp.]|nr:hypothetical protein [Fervidobacterium sp.]
MPTEDEPITGTIADLFKNKDVFWKTMIDSGAILFFAYGLNFIKGYKTFEDSFVYMFSSKAGRSLARGSIRSAIALMGYLSIDAITNGQFPMVMIYQPIRYISLSSSISLGFGLGFYDEYFKR